MSDNLDANLDALLDTQLDDLADLPDFVVPPAGAYRFTGKEFEVSADDDGNLIIILHLILNETLELVDKEATPIEEGLEVIHRYNLTNEFAQGLFKNVTAAYKEHFSVATLREVKEVFAGSEGAVVLNTRTAKQTPEQKAAKEEVKVYSGIKTLELA